MSLPIVATAAPRTPGVYFFVGDDDELLYVGKASDVRRRLADHARDGRAALSLVRDVRWIDCADEPAAACLEADLIVALRPRLNKSHVDGGRWNYVVTRVSPAGDDIVFELSRDAGVSGGRAYGCFPHLGGGVASHPGVVCTAGYPALLRLLWAACSPSRFPHRIARKGVPLVHRAAFDPEWERPLHDYLSGRSSRLVPALRAAIEMAEEGTAYLPPALEDDVQRASLFFTIGPAAMRSFRTGHGLPVGPVARETFEGVLAGDVQAAVGPLRFAPPPDEVAEQLGMLRSRG